VTDREKRGEKKNRVEMHGDCKSFQVRASKGKDYKRKERKYDK